MASGTTNISGKKLVGNAQSSDVLFGQTFSNAEGNSNVGSMPNKGALSVSLLINGNYTIPEGYHNGLGEVKQSILTKAAATYTPSIVNQTIDAGKYLSGAQTILGDADLISANIKAGKNIFGVAGNDNVVDTASGDAAASQILSGKKAYVQGALVTGTILSQAAATYTPSTVNQTISAGKYLSGAQTILGDADLISANIKAGQNIFGVAGNDNVVDTVSGDAAASQILSGKKAYVRGALVTGTIPSKTEEVYIVKPNDSQSIAAGQYLSGQQSIYAQINTAEGSVTTTGSLDTFTSADGINTSCQYIDFDLAILAFAPQYLIFYPYEYNGSTYPTYIKTDIFGFKTNVLANLLTRTMRFSIPISNGVTRIPLFAYGNTATLFKWMAIG